MEVKVQYFAITREIVNLREEILNLDRGVKVSDVLKVLAAKHNKLRDYLFDPKTGVPRSYLQFMVNGNQISSLDGYDTALTENCTFAIIPPVGGG